MANTFWDQSLKKGLMVAGILGCLAVAYYFAIFLPRTKNNSTDKTNQQNQIEFAANPKEYIASILQIGGEGSTSVTKSAWETLEGSHLNPDEFALMTTNTPVDVMWLSCKNGYTASNPTSQTGNQILSGVNKSTFGITLGTQLKNQLNITCTK